MDKIPWVIIGIIIGLIVVTILIVIAVKNKRKAASKELNYRALFILGATFIPLGLVYEITYLVSKSSVFLILGISLTGMGLTYLAIGLKNKDKWPTKKEN